MSKDKQTNNLREIRKTQTVIYVPITVEKSRSFLKRSSCKKTKDMNKLQK